MPDDTGTLERIGEQIAKALGDGPPEPRLAAQKRDFMSIISAEHHPKRFKYLGLALAASFFATTIGVVGFLWRETHPLQFWVGEHLAVGSEGTWMEPAATGSLPIRFEGGTTFNLREKTAVRIASSNEEKVEIELKGGEILADVKGNGKTRWIISAGPYQVHVIGTVFTTLWDEALSLLEVSVQKGAVVVHGKGIGEQGVSVAAGDHLKIDNAIVLVSIESAKVAARGTAGFSTTGQTDSLGSEADPKQRDVEPGVDAEHEKISSKARSHDSPRQKVSVQRRDEDEKSAPTWKDFYKTKDFDKAISTAEKLGLYELMTSLDHEDLWQLANAARYARKGKISTDILLAIRKRFGGYRRAEAATFLLGRVALELENDPAGARQWFETYLKESPNGSLSEEALGRLVDACGQAGRQEEARQKATLYLTRYPDGLFAELARSVLNK
jgi:transmembrane sensor